MQNMSKYVVLKKGLAGLPSLVKPSEVMDVIEKDPKGINSDWYQSIHYYNDSHVQLLKEKGTLRGVTDVKTDKLVFDFDDAVKPENAKKDALELCQRLTKEGIKESNIEAYYSGNKGFHVIITLNKELTPRQAQLAATKFATGLATFDTTLYDSAQILRVPWTLNKQHYKIPLTVKQLESPMAKIQYMAKDINNVEGEFNWGKTDINEEYFKEPPIVKVESKSVNQTSSGTGLLASKPRHWPDYKWALLNAVQVKESERHQALMVLAATCKGLGYPEEMTRALCLTFDEKFQANTKKPPVEDLDSNILTTVYSDKWSGGAYSIKNNIWLQEYSKRVGVNPKNNVDNQVMGIDSVLGEFEDFSENFEQNIIKTGIEELDNNSLFLTSTHNGILGQPGSGKTSFIIQWLEHLSAQNQHCMFYSLDMAESIIGAKLIQRVSGLSFRDATKLSRTNPAKYRQVREQIVERFKNVQFIFTSGTKVEDIKETIQKHEEETGNKIRFLCVDYLECLQGPYSDATANTGYISQQMKDLARETKVCSVILLQTQKSTGGGEVSEPLLSMKNIKGSSVIEQSATTLLTLWREGYSPKFQQYDKYLSFAIVKNRFGPLWTDDFNWEGARGQVGQVLGDMERDLLQKLREDKKKAKAAVEAEKAEWN